MIQESETRRNARVYADEEEVEAVERKAAAAGGWSSDECGARVHRLGGEKGVDRGGGGRYV